jgi:hypothetical protein
VLDFGVQINSSSNEDFSGGSISDSQMQGEVVSYASGYYGCSGNDALTIAVGTSNDGGGGSGYGEAWAYEVQSIRSAVDNAGLGNKVIVWAGMDFETNWANVSGSVSSLSNAESWANGYSSISGRPFYVDFGSANGCPPYGGCNNGWTQQGEQYVAYGAAPALAAPEIYYYSNAQQWASINGSNPMSFIGITDEYPRDTSTNTSGQAWVDLTSLTGQDPSFSTEFQSGYM